jgi:hypothetical protein
MVIIKLLEYEFMFQTKSQTEVEKMSPDKEPQKHHSFVMMKNANL